MWLTVGLLPELYILNLVVELDELDKMVEKSVW